MGCHTGTRRAWPESLIRLATLSFTIKINLLNGFMIRLFKCLSCQLVGHKGEEEAIHGYSYSYHMDFVTYQDRHLDNNQIMKVQQVYLYSKRDLWQAKPS